MEYLKVNPHTFQGQRRGGFKSESVAIKQQSAGQKMQGGENITLNKSKGSGMNLK